VPATSSGAAVLAAVDFNEGHRYADYLPGKDKAATYGVVGLIAGAAAVKAGFFKVVWVAILALKKFILLGLAAAAAAAAAAFKRYFGRRKNNVPEPAGASPRAPAGNGTT
jgi:uncharacterized membrane-anchored protein